MEIVKDLEEIKKMVSYYFSMDENIRFKHLELFPIIHKDYYKFMDCYDLLTYDKTQICDVDIIQMSNLEFYCNVLFQMSDGVNMIWLDKFNTFIKLCFHKEMSDVQLGMIDDELIIKIGEDGFTSDEFDFIKRVILCQTILDYDDTYKDPEVAKAERDYYEFMNRGVHMPTMEEQNSVITSVTGITIKELKDLTHREFCNLFEYCRGQIDFIALSGKTEKPMPHWIYGNKQKDSAFTKGGALGNIIDSSEIIKEQNL